MAKEKTKKVPVTEDGIPIIIGRGAVVEWKSSREEEVVPDLYTITEVGKDGTVRFKEMPLTLSATELVEGLLSAQFSLRHLGKQPGVPVPDPTQPKDNQSNKSKKSSKDGKKRTNQGRDKNNSNSGDGDRRDTGRQGEGEAEHQAL